MRMFSISKGTASRRETHTFEERSHCTRISRAEVYTVPNLSSDMHETFGVLILKIITRVDMLIQMEKNMIKTSHHKHHFTSCA